MTTKSGFIGRYREAVITITATVGLVTVLATSIYRAYGEELVRDTARAIAREEARAIADTAAARAVEPIRREVDDLSLGVRTLILYQKIKDPVGWHRAEELTK